MAWRSGDCNENLQHSPPSSLWPANGYRGSALRPSQLRGSCRRRCHPRPFSPAPRPRAPPCKLALIDYADHCTPMSYVIFPVCKRARRFCKLKLGSPPSPVPRNNSPYLDIIMSGPPWSDLPPVGTACKVAAIACAAPGVRIGRWVSGSAGGCPERFFARGWKTGHAHYLSPGSSTGDSGGGATRVRNFLRAVHSTSRSRFFSVNTFPVVAGSSLVLSSLRMPKPGRRYRRRPRT